jgi:hypothetical protein
MSYNSLESLREQQNQVCRMETTEKNSLEIKVEKSLEELNIII